MKKRKNREKTIEFGFLRFRKIRFKRFKNFLD